MARTRAKVTIKGADELKAKLRRMKAAAQGPALEAAASAGILPIQNAMIDKAPYLTGTLQRSIHTVPLIAEQYRAMVATGTDVPYAMRLEFGYNDTDALGREYHQAARPYARPAYDEQRSAAIRETTSALLDIILAAAGV